MIKFRNNPTTIAIFSEGNAIRAGQTGVFSYTGIFADGDNKGREFDSNRKDPNGMSLRLDIDGGQVIRGWGLGLIGMKKGEKRRLKIPASLGYGSQGRGAIPGGATLIFQVELKNVQG